MRSGLRDAYTLTSQQRNLSKRQQAEGSTLACLNVTNFLLDKLKMCIAESQVTRAQAGTCLICLQEHSHCIHALGPPTGQQVATRSQESNKMVK